MTKYEVVNKIILKYLKNVNKSLNYLFLYDISLSDSLTI